MNHKLKAVDRPKTTPVREETSHFEVWRGLLDDCLRKPKKKCVHALRVATLRLEAEVEQGLQSHKAHDLAVHAAKRWRNQAVKLRRALSDVREIDVHLARLAVLCTSLATHGDYQPRSSRQSLHRIGTLQSWLKQERRTAAKQLSAAMDARRERLLRVSREIESHFPGRDSSDKKRGAQTVLGMMDQLASDFPRLTTDSLHDFRKRVKKVRYQADLLASAEPAIASLAGVLKRMQDAIGEWHDWQDLAKLALRRFGKHSDDGGLQELLATQTDESLEKALSFCARELARFQHASREDGPSRASIDKMPVRRAEPPSAPSTSRLA
jgi:CHAD domain-containing protein